MNLNQRSGYWLAAAAALMVACVIVLSKLLLTRDDILTFTWVWFSFGNLWLGLFCWARKSFPRWEDVRANRNRILFVGLVQPTGAALYFYVIFLIPAPVMAFYAQTEPVFNILLGMLILGERFRKKDWVAIAVFLLGAALLTWRGEARLDRALAAVTLMSLLYAACNTQTRHIVRRMPPMAFAWVRGFLMWFFLSLALALRGDPRWPQGAQWLGMALGGLIGPCLAIMFWYESLKRIELVHAAILKNLTPLFVLALSFPIFSQLPQGHRLAGGLLMMAGTVYLIWSRGQIQSGNSTPHPPNPQ